MVNTHCDLPLEGVTVTLIDANTGAIVTTDAYGNTISGMTSTDAAGLYLFDSLPLGNYYVEFDVEGREVARLVRKYA